MLAEDVPVEDLSDLILRNYGSTTAGFTDLSLEVLDKHFVERLKGAENAPTLIAFAGRLTTTQSDLPDARVRQQIKKPRPMRPSVQTIAARILH